MVFAGVLGSSVRLGSLRLAGPRLAPNVTCHIRFSNARSFSLLLQNSARVHNTKLRLLVTSRKITQPASATSPTTSSVLADETSQAAVPAGDVPLDSSVELIPDFTDAAMSHLPAALQYGDLAALGLVSWTPAGLVRWSLEVINITSGLPWFWTLVAGSIFWKAVLFPLSVKGLQNSARMLPLQPFILKGQKEVEAARAKGDKLAMQRAGVKMRKVYSDAGVNLLYTALVPLIQVPITLGTFFGVKKMCDLPLLQLANSGLDILPDLTVPDPYMILPVLLCAAVNMQISIGAAELNLQDRPEMGHIMNGLRILSVAGIWFMSALPSGLMVTLVTTSFATTVQSYALQQPKLRRALNIPEVPMDMRGQLPSLKSSVQYVIEKYRSKIDEATAVAKQQQKRK